MVYAFALVKPTVTIEACYPSGKSTGYLERHPEEDPEEVAQQIDKHVCRRQPHDTHFFRTSKLIYDESKPVFYSANAIHFSVIGENGFFLAKLADDYQL